MSKKTKKQHKWRLRRGFVFWLVVFWVVVWLLAFSLQVFDRTGVSALALDFDTVLAIITLLTFVITSYGANVLSWIRIGYMKRGKR